MSAIEFRDALAGFELRGFGDAFNVRRSAIKLSPSLLAAGSRLETEFCCDHHLAAEWSQSLSNDFFICEWSINFGGVEESHATFHGGADEKNPFFIAEGMPIVLDE